jgi:2-iminoacetate synthase ThiH
MSDAVDALRLTDPSLYPVAEKVLAGERLEPADGLALYATSDLLGLGRLAERANARRNGDRVFFSANQHINPTNVCVLRNTCTFCSFARMPKEEGAYTRSLEEVFHEAEQARGMPTREFHIVGGLHPKLRLSYYTEMLRGLKERHPQVHIKALTAVEIAHLARVERTSEREVLVALRRPGSPVSLAAVPRCSAPQSAPPSPSASSRARSGSGCTGRRTSWASRPTAPCSTATWKPRRTASSTSPCFARCRTTPAVS